MAWALSECRQQYCRHNQLIILRKDESCAAPPKALESICRWHEVGQPELCGAPNRLMDLAGRHNGEGKKLNEREHHGRTDPFGGR